MSTAAATLQREIPFLRTERLLFTMHYKRLVFSLITFCAALYFPAFIVARTLQHTRNLPARQIDEILDVICFAVVTLIALPAGTAAFSRAFKEQNVLFFHALPLSRTRQWIVVVTGSFAALLSAMLFLWMLRPSAPAQVPASAMALIFSFIVISFAAGACFALAFLRPVEVYIGAYFLTFWLLIGAMWSAASPSIIYFIPQAQMRVVSDAAVDVFAGNIPGKEPLIILPLIGILYLALFLIASHRFYVRGEITLTRNRIRYPIIVAVIGLAIDFLLVPAMLYGFAIRKPARIRDLRVSPDARYAAVHYARDDAPWIASIRVIDVRDGRTISKFDASGTVELWFMGDALAIVERDMSWHRRFPGFVPRDRLELRAPDGHLVSRTTLDGETVVDALRMSPSEVAVGLRRENDEARIVSWNHAGAVRELAHVTGVIGLRVGMGAAYAMRHTGRSHVWRIDKTVVELPWSGAANPENPTIVRGVAYATPELAIREIERTNPAPRKADDVVLYAVRANVLVDTDRLFALVFDRAKHAGSLWIERDHGWAHIADNLKSEDPLPAGAAAPLDLRVNDLALARTQPIAAFAVRSAGRCTIRLYDGRKEQTLDLLTVDDPRNEIYPSLRFASADQHIVAVYAQRQANPMEFRTIAEFLYRDGRLHPLGRPAGYLAAVLPNGTQIREMNQTTFVVVPLEGKPRTIRF